MIPGLGPGMRPAASSEKGPRKALRKQLLGLLQNTLECI